MNCGLRLVYDQLSEKLMAFSSAWRCYQQPKYKRHAIMWTLLFLTTWQGWRVSRNGKRLLKCFYVNQTSIWFTSIICHFVVWRSRKHKYIWNLLYQLPCLYRTRQKKSYNSHVNFTTCPLFRIIIYNQQGLCSFQELKEYFSLPSTKSSMTLKTHGVPWTHSYFFHSLSELF